MNHRLKAALGTGLGAAAIATAAAFAFAPTVHGAWLWDDPTEIVENPFLRNPGGLWRIWTGHAGQDYFPLTGSVQWVQWQLWGNHVAGYHITNAVLHILSALLLWGVLKKLFVQGRESRDAARDIRPKSLDGGRERGPIAGAEWLGGLLFAVHPLVVESVAWISELKNTLSLPFLLLAMLAWIAWGERAARAALLYGCALLFFLAAMLCKSSVVMFPAILLLHAWWRRGRVGWKDLGASAPFFAVSLVLGLITIHFQTARAMAHLPMPAEGLAARIAAAGPSAAFYFAKAILPFGLIPIYPRWTLDSSAPWSVPAWTAIIAGLGWCWTRRATWGRHALLGLGFFLLNLMPVLGFIPMAYLRISRVSDHFAYLPLVGLIGLASAAISKIETRSPKFAAVAIAALVAALAIASRSYSRIFTSEKTLWTYTLRRNPQAWLAHNNLGIVLAESGQLDEAIAHGEEAVRLKPDFPEARSNLGLSLTEARRYGEAISQLEEAIRLRPDLAGAHLNLGRALLFAGRSPEAITQFEQALSLKPNDPEARKDLAVSRNNLGNALARAGRLPEAVAEFDRALQLDPNNGGVRRNLGYALQAMGEDRKAELQFNEANRIERSH